MAEPLIERSKARSILDRSEVKKDEYVEITPEMARVPEIPEPPAKRHLLHLPHIRPEEHPRLHSIGESLRHEFGITGDTPSERIASILKGIHHGIESAVERKKREWGTVPETEAVMPSAFITPVTPLPEEQLLICKPVSRKRLEQVI